MKLQTPNFFIIKKTFIVSLKCFSRLSLFWFSNGFMPKKNFTKNIKLPKSLIHINTYRKQTQQITKIAVELQCWNTEASGFFRFYLKNYLLMLVKFFSEYEFMLKKKNLYQKLTQIHCSFEIAPKCFLMVTFGTVFFSSDLESQASMCMYYVHVYEMLHFAQ